MEAKGLKKELGLITLISLGIGGMIGSGIFALPAALSAVSGPALILAIIISGAITMFLGLAYAELGATFPLTGGPYALPKLAMGNFGGFLIGWGYLLYLFIATAGVIDIFVVYLGFYWPGLSIGHTLTPLGIGVALIFLWLFTIINIFGVKWGGLYSVVTTIGKIIPLVVFILVGLIYFKSGNFSPFMPFGFKGVTLAVTLFFWAYTGFEAIVIPAEEVKNPARNIPLAIIIAILLTIVIYTFIALVFIGMLDWQGLHLSPKDWHEVGKLSFADVSIAIGLPWLAAIATIGAIISTAGAGGSRVLVQGRLPFAMAKDKLFWEPIAKLNPKYNTPVAGLLLTSVLSSIVLITIPSFPCVALMASVISVVPYAAAVLAVPILRKTKSKVHRPFKLPMMMPLMVVSFILATFLIYWASWPWNFVGTLLLLSGYGAFTLVKGSKWEIKRNIWIVVYLLGIILVSLLGDPSISFNNFTPINPMGYLKMPYDLLILSIFSVFIFIWGYKVNIKEE